MNRLAALLCAGVATFATAASAADLGRPAMPANTVITAPFSWTGFYAGVNGGYTLAGVNFDSDRRPGSFNISGGMIGGHVGYHHQFSNNVVLGFVGDLAWIGAKGSLCVETNGPCVPGERDSTVDAKATWLGTVRGNLGFAVSGDLLLYATGGIAFGGVESRITYITGPNDADAVNKSTRMGWTVGAGLNYRVTSNWSVGAEYLYVNYGTKTQTFTGSEFGPLDARVKLDQHVIRASLTYHFGGPAAPIMARY